MSVLTAAAAAAAVMLLYSDPTMLSSAIAKPEHNTDTTNIDECVCGIG